MAPPKTGEIKKTWVSNIGVVFALLAALTIGMAFALRFLFESLSF